MTAFLQAAGTGATMAGQIQGGLDKQAAYDANATYLQQQGTQQRSITIEQGQQQGRAELQRAGSARAAYGAAGVDPNSGSPLSVMSDTATQGELAKQLTIWQGVTQQQSADSQASIDQMQGKAAKAAGYTAATATLFNGAAQIAGSSGASAFGTGSMFA